MNEKGDVTDSILGWIQDHDIAELAHDTERGQVAQQLAALRAEVARQGEAIRRLVTHLANGRLGAGATMPGAAAEDVMNALDPEAWVEWAGSRGPDAEPLIDGYTAAEWASVGVNASAPDASGEQPPLGNIRVLPSQPLWDCIAAWMQPYERADGYCPRCGMNRTGRVCDGCMGDLDAILRETGPRWMRPPTPPADTPLPGPVADAEMRRAEPLSPLSPEVEAALAVIRKASDAGLFDAKPETARALAAWARAQQQPALPADVREAMREAAAMLRSVAQGPFVGVHRPNANRLAARLRELAGEP